MASRHPALCLLAVTSLLLAHPALAVPFLLPEGEPATRWQAALPLGGDALLDPREPRVMGAPWVELQRTAQADQWRLRVHDQQGTLHEVEVFVPVTERQREEIVVLAASLLHPVAGGAGGLWDALALAEEPPPLPLELPPPLPVEQPPPLPSRPPPLPVEAPPPLPVEPPPEPPEQPPPLPIALEPPSPEPPTPEPEPPTPEPEPPTPEPEPEPPIPEPVTVVPIGPTSVVVWTRVLGVVDTGWGEPEAAPGGGVQVGAVLRGGLRLGVGFGSQWFQSLPAEGQDPERYAEIQESDAYLCLLWSPSWRVAPLAGLRGGGAIRTLYKQGNVGGGRYERQAVSTYGEGYSPSPLPIVGLDLGVSTPLGAGLRLQPFANLLVDVSGLEEPWRYELTNEQQIELSPFSLHLGLALHLQPDARPE
jgi:hypothetical protein